MKAYPRYLNWLMIMLGCLAPRWLGAQTDIFMKIQPTTFRPVRLLLGQFTCEARPESAREVRQILVDDLSYSGYVTIIERNDADSNNITESVDMIAEAVLTVESRKLLCELSLKETLSGWKVLNKKFNHPLGSERNLAHTMADEIIYRLTGEYGIANTKIAYIKSIEGHKELALMDYDGANQRIVTSMKALCLSPDWAPDGRQLVFSALKPSVSLGGKITFYNLNSEHFFTFNQISGPASSPVIAPDGKKVAFTITTNGNTDIYVADLKGNNLQRLTQNPAIDTDPSWSPNGKSIVFTSDRSGSPQVYIMDADGANVRRLTFINNYNASPVWSPRGDLIAYVSQENGNFQLYVITPDGENAQRLTDGSGSYENPSWAPNGQHLACASNRAGKWDIYSLMVDGTRLRRLTFSGNNTQPSWSPKFKN